MAFSFSNFFSSIGNNIDKIGVATASAVGAWAGIKAKKQDIALQQAQVKAEIARINAQNNASVAASQAQAAQVRSAQTSVMFPVSSTQAHGGFLSGIPSWMLVAGAVGGFFLIRGAVR